MLSTEGGFSPTGDMLMVTMQQEPGWSLADLLVPVAACPTHTKDGGTCGPGSPLWGAAGAGILAL